MLKKHIRTLLTVICSLILVFQVTQMANAATVTWSSGGDVYTASVAKTTSGTINKAIPNTVAYHSSGTSTSVNISAGTTVTTGNMLPSTAFPGTTAVERLHLLQAYSNEGLVESATKTFSTKTTKVIPSSYTSGTYQLYIQFYSYHANWHVHQILEGIYENPNYTKYGTLVFCPTGQYSDPYFVKIG